MLEKVLLLLLVVLGWVYYRWTRVRKYWANRKVPYRSPHPLLGSMTFLQKINIMEWLRNEYKYYKGTPYFGIWLFWRPALVISDPRLARNILVKDFDAFRDRFISSGNSDPIGALNIFTLNDPLWSSVRRRLTVLFTASKLRALHPLIAHKSKELVRRIQNDFVEDNKSVNLRDLYADYTTDIIGSAAFGVDGEATLTGSSTMRNITKEFQTYSLIRALHFSCIFFFPELCDIFRVRFFTDDTNSYFREVFAKIVAQRGGWEGNTSETRDLIDALLRMRRESNTDGEGMSEDLIVAQAAIFLQGGFDTSAVSLVFTTYELAYYPEIQERLYSEIMDAKSKSGGELDISAMSELQYLTCVIKETLRKYPAMGYLDRIAMRDYQVDDKLTIAKGTPVYINAYGMQYDPEYYPDPMKYNPDRFLDESNIVPFTFLPFGEGPRNCIGMRFAYQTIRSALCNVVMSYKLRPVPGADPPEKLTLDPRGVFAAPSTPLAIQFIPR